MTAPGDNGSYDGTNDLVGDTDPERIEEVAARMPIDPSPQEVDAYRDAIGDDTDPGPDAG